MDISNFLETAGIAFGTSLVTNTGSQILSGPLSTLNDWWYVKFGNRSAEERALMVARQEANAEKLKMEILKNVQQIPDENLQEPSISILGPAIEASRFYINDDEIRTMFAKLISASLDDRKNELIHHSFVEIIKQMSPLDAKILNLFSNSTAIPTAKYKLQIDKTGSSKKLSDLIFLEIDCSYLSSAVSIYNLERLGLITVVFGEWLTNENLYKKFYDFQLFHNLQNSNPVTLRKAEYDRLINQFGREAVKSANHLDDAALDDILTNREVEVEKGIVEITPLGKAFINICC